MVLYMKQEHKHGPEAKTLILGKPKVSIRQVKQSITQI